MTVRELSDQYVLKTYTRYPLTFTHGEGMWLYTEDNKIWKALRDLSKCFKTGNFTLSCINKRKISYLT